ncbi:hypothetical protein EST38_g10618 [Candolleomyces aberdarensis]|uniref:JmjC domain-containing protein n=1 Tax=Candolleomyces aberdarensis TaxID=2316362 RepID=A0A4Q2D8I1_9AGAR|nr:hypothetical protein EST38_g10618 [Candolleomyces aberdarensis]
MSSEPTTLQVRLAEEYVGLGAKKKALTVVKNLLFLGFALSIMLEGNVAVPDEIGSDSSNGESLRKLFEEVDPSRLRQLVLQAVAISPLISLVPLDLARGAPVCPEETLINMRRLGNQKPCGILEIERTVWTAVFGISSGKHSAVAAFLKLHDGWVEENWEAKLSMEDRHFFARDAQVPYSPLESLCDSQISGPVPSDWPCVAGRNFITILNDVPRPTASDNDTPVDSTLGGGPSAGGEMDVIDDDGGEGGASAGTQTPQPNSEQVENNGASRRSGRLEGLGKPNGTPAEDQPDNEQANNGDAPRRSKRLGDQGAPNGVPVGEPSSLKPKRPRKAQKLLRKAREASVHCDDDDDDDDDVVVLAYADICIQSIEERRRLEEEIITKVEEDEERLAPVQKIKPALKIDNALSVYSTQHSTTFTFFDGKKQRHEYTPFIHDRGDYVAWTAIFNAITPQFVEKPESSLLRCMDSSTALQMPVQEFQNTLRRRSIVITNCTTERLQFNLQGLGKLADVDHQMDIQDQTIPVLDGRFQRRVFTGTLRDVYQTSIAPRHKKKSLNALYLPNPHALVEESPYATDVHAIHRIALQDKHCIRKMPTEDVRWCLAATEGAHHYFHMDSRGDGTFIDLVKGRKVWVIVQPKAGKKRTSTKLWTKENLDVTSLDPSEWDIEAVLLTEGTRLVMRPGTIHAVFTTEDAICRGGHFLATSTMSETLYGAIHCFFKGELLTNIDHPTIQSRVNVIVCYFYKALALGAPDLTIPAPGYLPDVSTQDGLEQIMATVCLVELHNVISFSSYQPTNEELVAWRLQEDSISTGDALSLYDISAATYASRMENIYSRGRAIALLKAVLGRVTIQERGGKAVDGWGELFIPMLAQLIVALRGYYETAFERVEGGEDDEDAEGVDEDGEPDAEGLQEQLGSEQDDFFIPSKVLFHRQLQWVSSRWPELQAAVDKKLASEDDDNEFLAWDFPQITVLVSPFTPSRKKSFSPAGLYLQLITPQ